MPVILFIHHCPGAGDLVIADHNAVFVHLLQVDSAADLPAFKGCVQALFDNVVVVFAVLQYLMHRGAKQ